MVKKFIVYGLLLCACFTILGGIIGFLVYNSQKLDAAKLEHNTNTITFFDNDDNEIGQRSARIDLDNTPPYLKWAFVCVEDKDFFHHKGISYERIAKATYKNIESKKAKEGASTISQQLIKNTHLTAEKTYNRKIREASLALKLEKQYTKKQILEMYLDVIYFGNGIYGINGASAFYFGKTPADLSVRECAALAGILRSPARYDPLQHEKSFTGRTNYVLSMMHAQGKISKDEYNTARDGDITITAKSRGSAPTAYVNAASAQASATLKMPQDEIAKNGYRVYTFFDRDTQDTVIETVTNPEYLIKNVSGAAADNLVIACSPDGRVSALHTNNRLLPTAKRNFASALKPLVVYAPAIETGTVNADTEIMDEPYAAGDFKPKNHDGKFHGTVTVREAITNSYNVPAVKILEYTTVARAVDVAKGLGLPLGDENLSLALGNVSNGVTAYQVLGGYCAIVNGGFLTTPSLIKRIENANGSVVWEYTNPHVRALSAHTAATVTDLLQSVVKQGTARKMAAIGFDIAGKTGTAERIGTGTNTDAVNISFTPTNVLLVWNGNASMTEKCDLPRGTSGGGITTYVARDIMKHINKDKAEFKKAEKANRNDKVDTEAKGKTTPADTTAVSAATKKLSVPTLKIDGAVGENGAPRLTFKTEKGTKYECYRAISGTPTVLQVVGGSGDEHTFYDNTAPANTIIEYWVCDKSQRSNTLKIYSPKQINRDAKAKSKSKQWWF